MRRFWIDENMSDDDDQTVYQGDDGRVRVAGKIQVTNDEEGFFALLHEAEKDGEL